MKPVERGLDELRRRYEQTLSREATVVPFDRDAARSYAAIRRDRGIRAPDAIQLATRRAPGWISSSPATTA